MYVHPKCIVPTEVRRGRWGPWNWSHRLSWTAVWVMELSLDPVKAVCALHHRANSPGPHLSYIAPQRFWYWNDLSCTVILLENILGHLIFYIKIYTHLIEFYKIPSCRLSVNKQAIIFHLLRPLKICLKTYFPYRGLTLLQGLFSNPFTLWCVVNGVILITFPCLLLAYR